MKATVRNLSETITKALGPIFMEDPDWETIRIAMCLVMARVIQSSPHKGREQSILTQCHEDIGHALQQFMQLEEQAVNARAAERDRVRAKIETGIDGFGSLVEAGPVTILSDAGPALVGGPAVVEAEATLQIDDRLPEDEDFPDSFEAPKAEDA